jgi:hypothetical protein
VIDANRLRLDIDSSMLGVCTAPECITIIFGHGTCVDHDPPRLHPADTLLDEALGGGRVPLAIDAWQTQTIES